MTIRGMAAWLLAMVLLTSAAHAHGGVSMQYKRCILRIGPDLMFYTGYQPQNSREEFCDDIPSTGHTVVALDMQDTELRDMTTEIRIIKDLGTHTRMNGLPVLTDAELASPEILDPVTIAYVAPKKYPTGTLTFEHTFPEYGEFIGIVTVKNSHGQTYVSQFPFSVGQSVRKSLLFYGLMVLAAVGGVFGFWYYSRGHKAAPTKKAV
ncbi:hypothetical protein CU048_11760 [Beijerinckiaceae bacterium]|nr:hypothetical protein CU048_11760 [Beijerinckiaceae bacterium]